MLVVVMVNSHLAYLSSADASNIASAPPSAFRGTAAAASQRSIRRPYSAYSQRHPRQGAAVPAVDPLLARRTERVEGGGTAAVFADAPRVPPGHLSSATLRTIFRYYATFGDRANSRVLLDGAKFAKFCRELRLLDGRVTNH